MKNKKVEYLKYPPFGSLLYVKKSSSYTILLLKGIFLKNSFGKKSHPNQMNSPCTNNFAFWGLLFRMGWITIPQFKNNLNSKPGINVFKIQNDLFN
jgi:hypothetical protein